MAYIAVSLVNRAHDKFIVNPRVIVQGCTLHYIHTLISAHQTNHTYGYVYAYDINEVEKEATRKTSASHQLNKGSLVDIVTTTTHKNI